MNLNSIMRLAYLLGWAFAVIAIVYRLLEVLQVSFVVHLPVTSRGVLMFSGFLFLASIATAMYAKAQGAQAK